MNESPLFGQLKEKVTEELNSQQKAAEAAEKRRQAEETGKKRREEDAELLKTSPYTQMLQEAAGILQEAHPDVQIAVRRPDKYNNPIELVMSWNVQVTGVDHGVGSDSYDRDLYSYNKVTMGVSRDRGGTVTGFNVNNNPRGEKRTRFYKAVDTQTINLEDDAEAAMKVLEGAILNPIFVTGSYGRESGRYSDYYDEVEIPTSSPDVE